MIMHSNSKSNSIVQYFDCFSSMANAQVDSSNLEQWQGYVSRHSGEGKDCLDWFGMESIPALRSAVELHGWADGALSGQEKFGHIKAPSLPSIKRKRCKGSYGHTLNMASMYSGNFDKAWLTAKKTPSESRMKRSGNVNIVIDVGGNAHVDSSAFFWRGAVGVMLARALQKSGRNTRILSAASNRGYTYETGAGTSYVCTVTNIKDYGVPITLDSMFALTALSGGFRYYYFKAWCGLKRKLVSGFGSHRHLQEEDLEPLVDGNPVIIVSDIWNENQANKVVNELLERFK